ncbi:uncharacterized protein LOC106086644 [Stomoxys calcitrans]|uniref:Single domain-containing protein n=1 Tax=Stomoxys calcitrans TaxID=35570 RepID=A0A1I8NVD3_STOCA|nr:uncharacterized protein LOC106086644 [Stomoxys calcitrans]
MNCHILINILFVCIALTTGAVFRGIYKDSDHPDKCVMKNIDLVLSPGEEARHPDNCIRLMCHENNLLIGHSCGSIGPPNGCVLGKALEPTAPYPACCKREFICNNIDD